MSANSLVYTSADLDDPVLARRNSLLSGLNQSATLTYRSWGMLASTEESGTTVVTASGDSAEGLPSGLVTFVFTDIEGSTKLYKALGEAAAADVFDLHNAQLRLAWEHNNGHEVHTEGDSFFVAFEDTDDAVAAVIEAQQRIAAAPWPAGGEVKIRIGIHAGLAAPRNDDYMALSVHQAARVMSAAHGDQILITDSTANRLTRMHDCSTQRVGVFRLRDFDDPPVLLRVDPNGVAVNPAPPRAVPAAQHNLVPPLTSFVGRDADVVTVNALLEPGRAVTLVGPGGMGKTRLATEVGIEVAPAWDGGVWMVELAEIVDPELIDDEIAKAIGVGGASLTDRWVDVIDHIGDSAMLLLLDNVEHLIDRSAELVAELLRACPNLSVLVTSREPLNCAGEVLYRVRSLDSVDPAVDPTDLASVELFIDRAQAVSGQLQWTPEALRDVMSICAALDGLPLAIEIAAAQVRVRQLGEIRDGLQDRFRLLRSRSRDLPDRHRTMDGLLGWSYRLLNETEQTAFRRLAVFKGSFSIDAAEAALAGDGIDGDDVPELIWTLVDKSLIAADLSESATRYRLFESVQQYAMRLLVDADDPVAVASLLGRWLLERIAPWQTQDRGWLGDVAIELANIRNVVELVGPTEPETALQLMCSVGRYHDSTQSYHTGVESLLRALEESTSESASRVALQITLSDLYLRMGDDDAAERYLNDARALRSQVGSPAWIDVGLDRAAAEIATRAGDYEAAIQIARSTLAEDLTDRGVARMYTSLGIAEASAGRFVEGLGALEMALEAHLKTGDAANVALARGNIAEVAWRLEMFEKTASNQAQCLHEGLAVGQQVAIANSFIMAARLAAMRLHWATAVRVQACAETLLQRADHDLYDEDSDALLSVFAKAENDLGAERVAELRTEGHAMTAIEASVLAFEAFENETNLVTNQRGQRDNGVPI